MSQTNFTETIDKHERLVNQIYQNMIIRGILFEPSNFDEEAIDKSELKILAYHVSKVEREENIKKVEEGIDSLFGTTFQASCCNEKGCICCSVSWECVERLKQKLAEMRGEKK